MWSFDVRPDAYTVAHYATVFRESGPLIGNTILYCGLAGLIDVVLGATLAYIVLRTRLPGRRLVEPPHLGELRVGDPLLQVAGAKVADLADLAGLSRFHLTRLFQRRFGLAPSAYLRLVRLERAKRLLASGDKPAGVAAALGFADVLAEGIDDAAFRDLVMPKAFTARFAAALEPAHAVLGLESAVQRRAWRWVVPICSRCSTPSSRW